MLVLLDGLTITVDSVTSVTFVEPITVYNFEVEDFHTYFVGNNGLLVHNHCNKKEIKQIKQVAKAYNMTELERREFGDYVEDHKIGCGMPPSHNLPYVVLEQLAEEFLGG